LESHFNSADSSPLPSEAFRTIEHMFVEGGGKAKLGPGSPASLVHTAEGELVEAPTDWIEREIGELAAHIAAATCRWLELVAEFDRREAHETWGFYSCGAWIAWRCSIDPRSAREHVRVARALRELPAVRERFSRGELSYSKVRAITRIATPEIEAELVEMARYATAAQLERLVRGYRRAVSAESAAAAHRDRYLAHEWDEDGCLCIRGRLAPEDGALFLKALEAGREAIQERSGGHEEEDSQGGSAEPEPPRRINDADALMQVAESALAGDRGVRPAGERYQVVVHADAAALQGDGEHGRCRLDDGPAIPAETARRLSCESSLISMLHGPTGTLDVGRKTRAIPPTLHRALQARDEGCCQFPGCENRRWVDAHHIRHWARGGETKLDNLVLLCTHHHRLLHEGGFTVSRQGDGRLVFRRPDGRVIPSLPSPTSGSCTELRARNRRTGLRIMPAASMPLGRGEPFDRDLAVAGLLARAGP
jgi:Domain of unknown function (DUF222)/HNH endonuclease